MLIAPLMTSKQVNHKIPSGKSPGWKKDHKRVKRKTYPITKEDLSYRLERLIISLRKTYHIAKREPLNSYF